MVRTGFAADQPVNILPADHSGAHFTGRERPRSSPPGGASTVLPQTRRPQRLISQIGCNQRQFAAMAQEGGNQCKAELARRHQ